MKPDRIQFGPSREKPRGTYHTYPFSTFVQATNFSNFVTDMAANYGLDVSCTLDSRHNQLTLLVSDDAAGKTEASWGFLDQVAAVHKSWSGPAESGPAES